MTRLTRFSTYGCRLAPLGSMEGPSAAALLPTFLTFVLFSSVWIPLSIILTVI